MLRLRNVKKYFGGVKAVNGCSFEIEPGKITALIGPNGAGKSTVFNLVSGILKADSGRIMFGKRNIANLSEYKISNYGISRLFQNSRLFGNLTVKQNLLLALDNEDTKFWKNLAGMNKVTKEKSERVEDVLKLVSMSEFGRKLARNLSYGQKRLVGIARAILNPHRFLMLDEPVAGVNPRLRKSIAKVLLKLKQEGETILLIEHDMEFALNIVDQVIVMHEGKVIVSGNPKAIKNNKQVLEVYLGE